MNKQIVVFYIGLMTLMSCSQDVTDGIFPQDPTMDNSPVAIRLGWDAPVIDTRANIESDAQGIFSSDSLGVFMLAMHKQDVSSSRVSPTWDPSDAEDSWLDNKWARIEGNNGVTFLNEYEEDTTYWYPLDNAYAYQFYAYQPYRDSITSIAGKRTIHYMNLDGTQDIIWGKTSYNANNKYAYSARYFNITTNKGMTPMINFDHLLMRLRFRLTGIPDTVKVTPSSNDSFDYTECNKMRLDSIWVKNVPTTADLVVADKNGSESGTLTTFWTDSVADLTVRGENDGVFTPIQVNNGDILSVGQPILLPVLTTEAEAERGAYQIGLQFSCEETNKSYYFDAINIDINSYEAGKTYTLTIKVGGPVRVSQLPNVHVTTND